MDQTPSGLSMIRPLIGIKKWGWSVALATMVVVSAAAPSRALSQSKDDTLRQLLKYTDTGDPKVFDSLENTWIERFFDRGKLPGVSESAQWLCRWYQESDEYRRRLAEAPYTSFYISILERDNFAVLRTCLQATLRGSSFGEFKRHGRINEDEDACNFVILACPRRFEAEKIDKILEFIGLKEGETIADIGAGFGFHAAIFSEIVGSSGWVYAVDPNDYAVKTLGEYVETNGITNLEVMEPVIGDPFWPERGVDYGVPPGSADKAFLMVVLEELLRLGPPFWREELVAGVSMGLKTGGELVICEKGEKHGKIKMLTRQDFIDIFTLNGFEYLATLPVMKELYCLKFVKIEEAPRIEISPHP